MSELAEASALQTVSLSLLSRFKSLRDLSMEAREALMALFCCRRSLRDLSMEAREALMAFFCCCRSPQVCLTSWCALHHRA